MRKFSLLMFVLALAGGSPEVGSDAWCKKRDAKPRGERTMHETGDYARHCIFN